MRVKNKKRFVSFVIILLFIVGVLIFYGVRAFNKTLSAAQTDYSLANDPDIKRVKDVFGPEILELIDGNEWGITSEMIANHPLPEEDGLKIDLKEEFSLPDNVFEKQEENECSGFAAAYLLRAKGINANGKGVYYSMPNDALPNGYRLPVDIVDRLGEEKIKAKLYTGTVETLKSRLCSKNTPVIVLTGDSFNWQHYITFVGYNDVLAEMYFYDSNVEGDENAEKPGNRTIGRAEFSKLWANGLPAFNNLYIAVE